VSTYARKHEFINFSEKQQKHGLSISKHVHSYFLQPLIKEDLPTNKKISETNNISGRCHEIYLPSSSGNRAGK